MKKDYNPIDVEIGKKIKLKRLERGLSQSELGEKVSLTFQQIQKYEKAYNSTRASKLVEIANALDVGVYYFFKGFDSKFSIPSGSESHMGENNDNSLFIHEVPKEREIEELTECYKNISNPESRKSILNLVKTLANG